MGSTLSKTGQKYTYCQLKRSNNDNSGNMYIFVKKKVYNIKLLYDHAKHPGSSEVLKIQTDKFIDQTKNIQFHNYNAQQKLNNYFTGYVTKCKFKCKICRDF